MAIASPALLFEIKRPEVVDQIEARTLATSIQSWQKHGTSAGDEATGLGAERMVPFLNNAQQVQRPPAIIWSHLLAFASLDPTNYQQIDHLVLRARVVSVVFAFILIAAVFWAGHSLGGLRTASLGALICTANPVFIYHARLATAPTQHAALTVLSIAASLWAIRPLRPAPSVERQFIGWVSCGLALGAAIYTGGPWTVFYVSVPVLIILFLCPGRVSHLLGLLAALLIGVLMVMPWAVYADGHDPQAHQQWQQSLKPADWTDIKALAEQTYQRSGMLLLALLPWTIWIIGAIIQPFSTSSVGSRRRMMFGWVWFACMLVLVILNPLEVRWADQLIILPAAAILFAQLFNQYVEMAAEGRYARFWRLLRWPHLVLLFIASVGVPALAYFQPTLIDHQWLTKKLAETSRWYFSVGLAIALLGLVGISLRWAIKHYPGRAVVCWAVWALVLIAFATFPIARATKNPVRQDARTLNVFSWGQAIFELRPEDYNGAQEINPDLLLYANRVIPPINEGQLAQAMEKESRFLLVVPESAHPPPPQLRLLTTLDTVGLRLWQYGEGGGGKGDQ